MMDDYRPVPGYEGLYSVDACGNVFSHERQRIVRPTKPEQTWGCVYVSLCKNGRNATHSVAELVANAFVPNPNGYHIVKHKNGNRTNCKARNLEWAATA